MSEQFTVDFLAKTALDATSGGMQRQLTYAWVKHFRENATIANGRLYYLATQIKLDEIKHPASIGALLLRRGAVLVESVLAHHLEKAIPHIAAYALDEFIQNDTGGIRDATTYRTYPNNEFLNEVKLFSTGPLVSGEIKYNDKVVWAQHLLWLRDTLMSEVCISNLHEQPLSDVFEHDFFKGDAKIIAISEMGESITFSPEIEVRSMQSLRVFRTARDGTLLTPNESAL